MAESREHARSARAWSSQASGTDRVQSYVGGRAGNWLEINQIIHWIYYLTLLTDSSTRELLVSTFNQQFGMKIAIHFSNNYNKWEHKFTWNKLTCCPLTDCRWSAVDLDHIWVVHRRDESSYDVCETIRNDRRFKIIILYRKRVKLGQQMWNCKK